MTKCGACGMMDRPARKGRPERRCYIKGGWPTNLLRRPNKREVVLMGNELRRFILRFVVSLGVVIMILLLTAPKAC